MKKILKVLNTSLIGIPRVESTILNVVTSGIVQGGAQIVSVAF